MLNVYEELGETSRRLILGELRRGPMTVNEIVAGTALKQPNVSNHLARMRSRGIVKFTKDGRKVVYCLASPEIEAVIHAVFSIRHEEPAAVEFATLADAYARAAVEGDEGACIQSLDSALCSEAGMLDIYEELLAPAMSLVGKWYADGIIDEGQEHLASAITERMMARTVQITGPGRRVGKLCLLGCAPNAWHVIGLRMIADYLRLSGWRALYLGANVPVRSFLTAIHQHKPQLVLMSCSAQEAVEPTLELIRSIVSFEPKDRKFLLGVGGLYVRKDPQVFLDAGADFTSDTLRSFARDQLPLIEGKAKR